MKKDTTTARWRFKLTVYTMDALIVSVSLLKYRLEEISPEKPLIKTAYDSNLNRCITMLYFRYYPACYLRLLDFASREYHSRYDAYLVQYDWDTKQLSKVAEHHRHGYGIDYPLTGGDR